MVCQRKVIFPLSRLPAFPLARLPFSLAHLLSLLHACLSSYTLAFPLAHLSSLLPCVLIVVSTPDSFRHSLCRLRPLEFSLVNFDMCVVIVLVRHTFRQSCWWHSFWPSQETQAHSKLSDPRAPAVFLPLFHSVFWALGVGVFWKCIHWDWVPQFWISMGCSFMQWTLSVAKGNFLSEKWELTYQ